MSHHSGLLTRIGFLCGWLFFILAFLLAAAESAVGRGFVTSTHDLFLALEPGKWIALKHRLESPLFTHLVMPLLSLPGWLLAGLPAGFLIWTCRPHREVIDPDLYVSLTTYDRLAKLAEEEGAPEDTPHYQTFDLKDYEEEEDKEIQGPVQTPGLHYRARMVEPPQTEKGAQARMRQSRDDLSIPYDKLT